MGKSMQHLLNIKLGRTSAYFIWWVRKFLQANWRLSILWNEFKLIESNVCWILLKPSLRTTYRAATCWEHPCIARTTDLSDVVRLRREMVIGIFGLHTELYEFTLNPVKKVVKATRAAFLNQGQGFTSGQEDGPRNVIAKAATMPPNRSTNQVKSKENNNER